MITIVGCGALGGLLAAMALDAGLPVQGLSRPGPHLDHCRRHGLRVIFPQHGERIYRFPLTDNPRELFPGDLVLVLVKAYHTATVAPMLSPLLAPRGLVLTLQNGLGNGEILENHVPAGHLALGACTYGAFRSAPGTVLWGGAGEITLGAWDAATDTTPGELLLRQTALTIHTTSAPHRTIWEKTVLNAAINPVTALARCPNGALLRSGDLQDTARTLCGEATQVARKEGFPLDEEVLWQRILQVLEATRQNRSSMLQDVERKRRTEVEAISGAVLARGRILKIPTPVTACVTALLRAQDSRAEEA